jgi:hypothetical protein
VSGIIIKPAVRQKIEDHGLTVAEVESVLAAPEQRVAGHHGRQVWPARRGRYLVRVVVEAGGPPLEVVTAYRTRNVVKYWQVNDAN